MMISYSGLGGVFGVMGNEQGCSPAVSTLSKESLVETVWSQKGPFKERKGIEMVEDGVRLQEELPNKRGQGRNFTGLQLGKS